MSLFVDLVCLLIIAALVGAAVLFVQIADRMVSNR